MLLKYSELNLFRNVSKNEGESGQSKVRKVNGA